MKLTNTFLVTCENISNNSRDPTRIIETMKHMMSTTLRRIKTMYVKDLFQSLVYHNIGTTEVHQLCSKLCSKITILKASTLVNNIMKWKYKDALKVYRKTVYDEKRLWKTYSSVYKEEGIINDYNALWCVEKGGFTKTCRADRKRKVKWLINKYKYNETIPDYINGIGIKDVVIDHTYTKEPIICGGATIDNAERSVLQLHPKYCVYDDIKLVECEAEIEKSLTMIRWKRKGICNDNVEHYDVDTNTLDFTKFRATDLPFCSHTYLPQPIGINEEIQLHNLKSDLINTTKGYLTNTNKNSRTNLTKVQQEGLESLIQRRKAKEIVLYQTDKSGSMSVDTVDNYVTAANVHIKDDQILNKKDITEMEKTCNSHALFWTNVLKMGSDTNGTDRIKMSMRSHNNSPGSMYFFRKDHKPAIESDGTNIGHPMRPLCDVSDAFSHKLSHLICLLLKEVSDDSTTICSSSEDLIASVENLNTSNVLNDESVIGSMDVKSMYPSLDIPTVIDIVTEEFYHSKVTLANVEYEELGLYLSLNRTVEYINSVQLTEVCPKRKKKKRPPRMTGSGSLPTKRGRFHPWIRRNRDPDEGECRILLKEGIKIALEVILNNHMYKFNNQVRKQNLGGPIGLDLTEVVAKIFMNWWDRQLLQLLEAQQHEVYLYRRYVDDITICLQGVPLTQGEHNIDELTFNLVSTISNSITKCIQIESDYPSKYEDNKIPILDLKIWIHKVDGHNTILYEHYVKPITSKHVINYNSALCLNTKRTILTQQLLKVMLNCSSNLPWEVTVSHLTHFVNRMQLSGYNKKFRYEIVLSMLHAFNSIKAEVERGIRPMYRSREWKKAERRKSKISKKKTWYQKGGNEAVLFVPATPRSTLANLYKSKAKENGISIKIVEKSGTKIRNRLQVNDPLSSRICPEEDKCFACQTSAKGNCKSTGINYEILCDHTDCESIYHGQSSKNGYTRGNEHFDDLTHKRDKSVMWKHCCDKHQRRNQEFKMTVTGTIRNDPTKRQITEAIHINNTDPSKLMNERTEWNYVRLPRVQIA